MRIFWLVLPTSKNGFRVKTSFKIGVLIRFRLGRVRDWVIHFAQSQKHRKTPKDMSCPP